MAGNATIRALKIIEILAGHEIKGLSNQEITQALGATNKSATFKDLQVLQSAGYATQDESKNWTLTPKITQISTKAARGFVEAKSKLDEIQQRHIGVIR